MAMLLFKMLYSLGGLLFGLGMWHLQERAYVKFREKAEELAPPDF